jgi:parallel beta-helix repeat protein
MKRKMVSAITLTLLLIGMLTLAFNIQPVKASGTIWIRGDGSVDPPTAPIQRVGDYYTFTANIYDSIIIERDSIVVDGAEYTVQGAASGAGIDLSGRSNETIKNIRITTFDYGIRLRFCSNNNISGNKITNTYAGILLEFSTDNSISGNYIIETNQYGIFFYNASDNSAFGNCIANNYYGIYIHDSSKNNSIFGNNIAHNSHCGIELSYSYNNVIYHNDLDNNQQVRIFLSNETVWDYGYPSGGNCWSDYTGVDHYSGQNQDQLGNDGIGDTPYIMDADNIDRYPLMIPYDAPPLPTYTLTITATVGGTTNPALGTYNYTAISLVQVTAVPNTGYLFDYWELDNVNVGSTNPTSVLTDHNQTLKTVFSAATPTPSPSPSPEPTPTPPSEEPQFFLYGAIAAVALAIISTTAFVLKKRRKQ